jgi:hypothetical protein
MKDIVKLLPGRSTGACESHWMHLKAEHVSFIQILFFYWFWSAFYFKISVVFEISWKKKKNHILQLLFTYTQICLVKPCTCYKCTIFVCSARSTSGT